ncbi:MAG: metallophosphoesterase [Planctomycetes bacterium]|nr:metallophosphoesterase [Planctomycetota bacterium]
MPPHTRRALELLAPAALFLAAPLAPSFSQQHTSGSAAPAQPLPIDDRSHVHFAVIGDYGNGTQQSVGVANTVKSLNPDFIATVGDNNYPLGEAATIDVNIGKIYHEFIGGYSGAFGPGSPTNRFFPSLGNHDWYTTGAAPYLAFFKLPGNERYYSHRAGPVELFFLDSDPNEPDGFLPTSIQGQWLQGALAASRAPFKLVLFHHAAYTSGASHGSSFWMQWPFREWGAHAVFGGHEHCYERLGIDGIPYVVSGHGGQPLNPLLQLSAGSLFHDASDWGAVAVDATPSALSIRAFKRTRAVIDMCTISGRYREVLDDVLLARRASWRYLDTGVFPGAQWTSPSFDDSSWSVGNAQLGYGDHDETTVIGFGPDPNNKYVTSWFRKTITVANPSQYAAMRLRALRDDGAVIYVNGAEAARYNMPGGAVLPATLASSSIPDAGEFNYYDALIPATFFAAGANTIAVEVHQAAVNSSDLSFDMEIQGMLPESVLVPIGSTWKYLDTGAAPPAAWTTVAFDDSTWQQGPAQLGYGDGDEATVVGFGGNPTQKHITTWFRKQFTVAGASHARRLILRAIRDDGIVVYVNGKEAYRENMILDAISSSTLASSSISGSNESALRETDLDPALLVDGLNVIAVEIHQSDAASSDLSFDLALSAK